MHFAVLVSVLQTIEVRVGVRVSVRVSVRRETYFHKPFPQRINTQSTTDDWVLGN